MVVKKISGLLDARIRHASSRTRGKERMFTQVNNFGPALENTKATKSFIVKFGTGMNFLCIIFPLISVNSSLG